MDNSAMRQATGLRRGTVKAAYVNATDSCAHLRVAGLRPGAPGARAKHSDGAL
jgi:hypothetical protein